VGVAARWQYERLLPANQLLNITYRSLIQELGIKVPSSKKNIDSITLLVVPTESRRLDSVGYLDSAEVSLAS